ncbi:MAG: class I SAM-dependent methyltransferase [Algoriphagus aquaeductus]|uniref:class I SAM-dependent methyltransferase n=1 Tax=Algoriphagus aquaeductus TaxID=475299 RepID=UPI003879BDAA
MYKVLIAFIPDSLKKKIGKLVFQWVKEKNRIQSAKLPNVQINEAVIKNTKLLLNREKLLEHLPKKGIVAELGVDEGNFSEVILNKCQPEKLHLIDIWASEIYNNAKRKYVEERFDPEIRSGIVEINLGYSTEIGAKFKDNYFDWIYIDTDHSYETTIRELEIWRLKVKEGGIIAGHDFIVGYWDGMIRYGVIEAVYQFCSKYHWELLYLTMEVDTHPSFAIKRLI